jgi:hypothetical protein
VYFVTYEASPGPGPRLQLEKEAPEQVSEAEEHENHDGYDRGDEAHHLEQL